MRGKFEVRRSGKGILEEKASSLVGHRERSLRPLAREKRQEATFDPNVI